MGEGRIKPIPSEGGTAQSTWSQRNSQELKYAGGAMQGAGMLVSGWANYKASKAQAQAMNANATNLDKQADNTLTQGRQNMMRARLNQTAAVGQATAARGASNVMAEGSGLDNEKTAMQRAEIEINDMGARALDEAQNLRHQAEMQRWEAWQKKQSGRWGFLASGFSALGSAASAG